MRALLEPARAILRSRGIALETRRLMPSTQDQTFSESGYAESSASSRTLAFDDDEPPFSEDLSEQHVDEEQLGQQRFEEQRLEQQQLEAQQSSDRDSLRKALRDLESAEARVRRDAERVYEQARGSLIQDLFPVLDNLDRCIEAAQESSDPALLAGVRMVRKQLDAVLARYGAERIDVTGGSFDPSVQEAVITMTVTDRLQDRTVLQQIAPGYRFGDRLLRPAKVVVGVYAS